MPFGIPPLLNQASQAVATGGLLVADAAAVVNLFFSTAQWGLFADGEPVIEPDSIISVEFKRDWRVVDYPMEKGAFESYNKVTLPFDARVKMTKGGTAAQREAFLEQVEAIAGTTDVYDVVTPEKTYIGTNIVHWDYRREANRGVGLITVDLWLLEIRQTVVPVYTTTATPTTPVSNPAAPSGADAVSTGTVQPQPPAPAVASAVSDRIARLNAIIANPRSVP